MSSQTAHGGLKLHAVCLGVAILFSASCMILSGLMPRLNFETGVQNTPSGSSVVIKRVYSQDEDVQQGDFIEAVSGKPVQTKTSFYHQLLHEKERAELTLRRTDSRYQRPVMASDFAHGALPVGVLPTDRPLLIADESGNYSKLQGVKFEDLRSLLETRNGAVSVVFKRHEEIVNASVELRGAPGRTFGCSLVFLLIAVMGIVAWKSVHCRNCRQQAWSNLTMCLSVIGILTLGLWTLLQSMPLLLMIGIMALTMVKAVDLDYHLMNGGRGRKIERWIRIALFAGPAATLILPVWFCLSEMPVLWGGVVDASTEIKADAFAFLPIMWAVIYTFIDTGVMIWRRARSESQPVRAYEIGLVLASFLCIFVFVLVRSDMLGAQWFLMAALLVQGLGNVLPFVGARPVRNDVRLDDPMFNLAPVREALDRAHEIVGSNWLVQIVVDRPTPKHVVSIVRSDDELAICGLELNVLSEPWRDFLEVFRIEGGCITGENRERDAHDPVQGIADRLGIVVALPIVDNVSGTLTSLTFLISQPGEPDPDVQPSISLSRTQREGLLDVIDALMSCGPAIVYQTAEMSLDFVGDDIDEFLRRPNHTEPYARAIQTTTQSIIQPDLPHGLLDEEEDDLNAITSDNEPVSDETVVKSGDDNTRVYDDEVMFLKSQLQALNSQQIRECALSEIEFTESQQQALEDIEALDPPMLFIGEPGTGKHLLSLAAHQMRSDGPFLTIDAAEAPESIFALDLFGDGENPGMIKAAAGGGLCIQNVDRLSEPLLKDVMDAVNQLAPKDSIGLYLCVTVCAEAFSVSQYRVEPLRMPKYLRELANLTDAEVIVLDPLRNQYDIDVVANFYRQKQAIRSNKNVESFSTEAQLAIKSYRWPGNFSELRSVIERAVMRCETDMISVADLGRDFVELADASTKNIALSSSDVFREQAEMLQALSESQQATIDRLNERIAQLEAETGTEKSNADDELLEGTFTDIERRLLDRLLDKYQRDPEKTADALAFNRSRFFAKLSKYQLINSDDSN